MICSHHFFLWILMILSGFRQFFFKNSNRCLKNVILKYKSKWRIKHTQDTIRFKSVPN